MPLVFRMLENGTSILLTLALKCEVSIFDMIKAVKAKGLGKILGLMFRTRKTQPLLFEFKHDVNLSIHSMFVFFPFRAIWLDSENKIIEQKTVRPFTFCVRPKKPFRKLIEIPQ